MQSVLWILALGFVLGMRHATDPDHVIAVSTIVARSRGIREAAWIGSLWGIGHTFTIVVVGGGIALLGWVIPVRLGLSMELSVGLMLVFLGIFNLTGIRQWIMENISRASQKLQSSPSHGHGEDAHAQPHSRNSFLPHRHDQPSVKWLDRHFGRLGFYPLIRPMVIGVIHGLAGSAGIALLLLATIRDPLWAAAYLVVFGVGTIAGMMLVTAAIAAPFAYSRGLPQGIHSWFRFASGWVSLWFGLFLVYQIVAVGRLFSNQPRWTPH
jgi:high-affinity nickel-transport protein